MSSAVNEIQVQNIDPLGIVAGIMDEIGLVEQVEEVLGTHPQAVVSLGQVLKAMILNVAGHKQITNLTPQRPKILQFLGATCGRYYLLK